MASGLALYPKLLLEPVVGEEPGVAWRDLDPAGGAIQGEGLGEDRVGLEVGDSGAAGHGTRFQHAEQAPAEPEPQVTATAG